MEKVGLTLHQALTKHSAVMSAFQSEEREQTQVASTDVDTQSISPDPSRQVPQTGGQVRSQPSIRQSSGVVGLLESIPAQQSSPSDAFDQSKSFPHVWKPVSIDLVRPAASVLPIASQLHSNSLQIHDLKGETEELRESHANLSRRVLQLATSIQTVNRSAMDNRTSVQHHEVVRDEFSLRRIRLFASNYVTKALRGPSSELSKKYAALNETNTVRQIVLKTKAVDCSLHEFRMLLAACTRDDSISCRIFPSEYYALLLHPTSASRFQILFRSFRDLCDALHIDLNSREESVYREKKSAGRVRAIRILGVAKTFSETSSGTASKMWIFLGRSFSSSFSLRNCPALVQKQAVWSHSDHCWETGLSLTLDASPEDMVNLQALTEAEPSASTQGVDATHINKLSKETNVFALTWERMGDTARTNDGSASSVCGTLRAHVPAVVLRSVNLTSTAQKAFTEKVQVHERNSSRNSLIYLKELLVSSNHGISQSSLPNEGS